MRIATFLGLSLLSLCLCGNVAHAQFGKFLTPSRISTLEFEEGLSLRIGEYLPKGQIKGDILYLHGFADSFDNHSELFASWTARGFRIIGFDYPSHGGTSGDLNDINLYNFSDLAEMAVAVERKTASQSRRPLILAGWSTGGLLAVRMVQGILFPKFSRDLSGVILFSPGIVVRPLVGDLGKVTLASLTRNTNPPVSGSFSIKPSSPLEKPLFAAALLSNALLSNTEFYPEQLPTLIILGGDDDKYVFTNQIKRWVNFQREHGADFQARECPEGYHWLDVEPDAVGFETRSDAADFAEHLISGKPNPLAKITDACALF